MALKMNKTKKPSVRQHFCCACLQLRKSLAERGFRPQAQFHISKLISVVKGGKKYVNF